MPVPYRAEIGPLKQPLSGFHIFKSKFRPRMKNYDAIGMLESRRNITHQLRKSFFFIISSGFDSRMLPTYISLHIVLARGNRPSPDFLQPRGLVGPGEHRCSGFHPSANDSWDYKGSAGVPFKWFICVSDPCATGACVCVFLAVG